MEQTRAVAAPRHQYNRNFFKSCTRKKTTHNNITVIQKLVVAQLVRIHSPPFKEPEGSLPRSQEFGPYPEPDESNPVSPIL
jgi:hypothetical protein